MSSQTSRLRIASWILIAICVTSATFVLYVTRTSVDVYSFAIIAPMLAILALIHLTYSWVRSIPSLGSLAGGVLAILVGGLASGMIALAALRNNAPLIDVYLAKSDKLIGIDTQMLVRWVSEHGLAAIPLNVAYLGTIPVIFGAVVFLALSGRETRMWELCCCFSGVGIICALSSTMFTAIGAFTNNSIPLDVVSRLPNGAGLFHLEVFNRFRSGEVSLIRIGDLEGVVTFPSFHAAMGLMTGYAFRNIRGASTIAWTWSAVVIISTIPVGGHYGVDIIAGAVVWRILLLLLQATVGSKEAAVSDASIRSQLLLIPNNRLP